MLESGIEDQESRDYPGRTRSGWYARGHHRPAQCGDRQSHEATQLPDVQAKCLELGLDVVANTPAKFAGYVEKEIGKWQSCHLTRLVALAAVAGLTRARDRPARAGWASLRRRLGGRGNRCCDDVGFD